MKKAFTLFEIIIVLLIVSIITTFLMMKSTSFLDNSISLKVKADVALIRDSISKQKAKNILLNKQTTFSLDEAMIDKKNEKLFENILDFPLVSTNSIEKQQGEWIKKSSNTYMVYLSNDMSLEYQYKDFKFECKNSNEICEQYQ